MKNIKLTEKDLNYIIKESINHILCEERNMVDNFDFFSKLMEKNENNYFFYFVQIIQRSKDNPHLHMEEWDEERKIKENYWRGGCYKEYWVVRNPEELFSIKDDVIALCHKYNGRAYVTLNYRSFRQNEWQVNKEKMKYNSNDPRYAHAFERVAGEQKYKTHNWDGKRPRLFLDIDTVVPEKVKQIFDILEKYNIPILGKYKTPKGGIHVILPNREDTNWLEARKELVDNYGKYIKKRNSIGKKIFVKDLSPSSIVLDEPDGKMILYANIDTTPYSV